MAQGLCHIDINFEQKPIQSIHIWREHELGVQAGKGEMALIGSHPRGPYAFEA